MRNKLTWRAAVLLCAAAAVGSPAFPARADVTITSEISVQGSLPQSSSRRMSSGGGAGAQTNTDAQSPDSTSPPPPTAVTVRFQGKMVRTEVANGAVTLYDGAVNKVYTLLPDKKTYSVMPMKQAQNPNAAAALHLPSSVSFDTTFNLDKADATQTVAGRSAQKYVLSATFQPERPSGGGGRRGFGGGFGGMGRGRFLTSDPSASEPGMQDPDDSSSPSGGYGRRGGQGRRSMPTFHVDGEVWVVDGALLPAENKNALLPLLAGAVGPVVPVLKPLCDRLAKLKLAPVSTKLTITVTRPGSTDTPDPMVITMTVTSVADGPVDATLFKVPSDYTKVDATAQTPAAPPRS